MMIARAFFSRERKISPSTTSRSDVDIPQLDIRSVEDFITLLKSLRSKNSKNAPWDFCHTLAEQLKWSRMLLSLLSVVSLESNVALKISNCVDVAYSILMADCVQLFETEKGGNSLKLVFAKTFDSFPVSSLIGYKYPKDFSIEAEAARLNEIINIKDAQLDHRYNSDLDQKFGILSRSLLCVPILNEHEICGVLKVVRKGSTELSADIKSQFNQNEEIMLKFIANMMSIILKETIQQKSISQQNIKIESLNRLFHYGITDFELNDIIQRTIDDASSILRAEKVSLFLHDQGHLVCHFSDDIKGLSIPCTIGIAGKSFMETAVLNIPNTELEKCFYSQMDVQVGYSTRSILSAPIVHEDGTVIGVIQALNKKGEIQFSESDVDMIKIVCQRTAFLLSKSNALLNKQKFSFGRQDVVSSCVQLHQCQSESQVLSLAKSLIKAYTNSTHVEVCKHVDGRLEIQTSGTRSSVSTQTENVDRESEVISSKTYTINIGALPSVLSEAMGKGELGETTMEQEDMRRTELKGFLPENMSDSASWHVMVLPLPLSDKAKKSSLDGHFLVVAREAKADVYTVLEKKILNLIIEILMAAIRNAKEKELLRLDIEQTKQAYHRVKNVMSKMHMYVILLSQDGYMLGSNKALDGFFGDMTDIKYNVPAIDPIDINRNYEANNRNFNFIRYADTLNTKLGEDIRLVMETGITKSADRVVLMTPVYPEGVSVKYEISRISSDTDNEAYQSEGVWLTDALQRNMPIRSSHNFHSVDNAEEFKDATGGVNTLANAFEAIMITMQVENHSTAVSPCTTETGAVDHDRSEGDTSSRVTSPSPEGGPERGAERDESFTLHVTHSNVCNSNNYDVRKSPSRTPRHLSPSASDKMLTSPANINIHIQHQMSEMIQEVNKTEEREQTMKQEERRKSIEVSDKELGMECILIEEEMAVMSSDQCYDIANKIDINQANMFLKEIIIYLQNLENIPQRAWNKSIKSEIESWREVITDFVDEVDQSVVMKRPPISAFTDDPDDSIREGSSKVRGVHSTDSPCLLGRIDTLNTEFEEILIWDWDFDVLEVSNSFSLQSIITRMFLLLFNFTELHINFERFETFLMLVERSYLENPFHNFYHATCVTHILAMFINDTNAREAMSPHLLFALLVSAVTHDIGHPGKTNAFMINSQSDLALTYNDDAVLENFHCSTTFSLLRKPNASMFAEISSEKYKEVRKMIINCILATDMAKHTQVVTEMKTDLMIGTDPPEPFLLGRVLLHAADLSNPVRKFSIAQKWAQRLSDEFGAQVELETKMGLPVQGWMVTKTPVALAKGEKNFISFNVKPMYELLTTKYSSLRCLFEQLNSNIGTYDEIISRHVNE